MATTLENTYMQLLLARKIISGEQFEQIYRLAKERKQDLFSLVGELPNLSLEELVKAKGEVLNRPYIDLMDQDISIEALQVLTSELAANYQVAAFRKQGDQVDVAMLNPQDFKAVEALDFIARQKKLFFNYYITTPSSLRHVLRKYENLNQEVADALQGTETKSVEQIEKDADTEAGDGKVKNAPVSKMISVILRHAIEGGASDIHIEPINNETRVRYRLEGALHTSLILPQNVHSSLVARIKVLANLKLDETRMPQDGRFKMKFENREIEFRVSTLPLLDKEKVVLRILDTAMSSKNLADLGFMDHNAEVIQRNIKIPHGLFLVTGPTGSGKSTTLYAILNLLNKEEVNIVTLEDPVEYNLPGISQAQIRPEVGLDFASGLRSILRQDPNIIMVGEIRDNETAELAVHSALTGHMVLSTLHTNDAVGAVPRLVDMKIEAFLLASSINVIVAQRLVRQICPNCKAEFALPEKLKQEVLVEVNKMPKEYLPADFPISGPWKFYQGKGCVHCEETGYAGRVAIVEVFEGTEQLKQCIANYSNERYDALSKEFMRQGMLNLKQDGIIKAWRGLTTLEEVWRVTKN